MRSEVEVGYDVAVDVLRDPRAEQRCHLVRSRPRRGWIPAIAVHGLVPLGHRREQTRVVEIVRPSNGRPRLQVLQRVQLGSYYLHQLELA